MDVHYVKSSSCNASCIRYSLVKLLRLSGYDAAVCASNWQGSGKVSRGDHEYIDVVDIATGVPRIWLKQLLQLMVEAARSPLKQNSMPFPPWRSLAYLQAKWQSPYQRRFTPDEHDTIGNVSSDHKQCNGHLRRLQSSLNSELEAERLLKLANINSNCRLKLDRRRHFSFRAL